MSAASEPRRPRFNHVAMTVASELLGPEGRKQILDFYGEVFGWTEMPSLSRDGELLVLRCYSNEQFVFLTGGEKLMQSGGMDHFGMSVSKVEELDGMLERARKYKERDAEVQIVEKRTEDHKAVVLHNFYVRYKLPLMIEVQCYEWAEGLGDQSLPE